jgi:hypothetical protein
MAEQMVAPPDEYQGVKQTARGTPYHIRRIPDKVPFEFCITLNLDGDEYPTVFVRSKKFDDPAAMERLLLHEGRHVDSWIEQGREKFILNWIRHSKRRKEEARGHSENVAWRISNDMTDPPHDGMGRLAYWMLHYAAEIDQHYHIRGSGIKAAYNDLAHYVREWHGLDPLPWGQVAKWKNEFRGQK